MKQVRVDEIINKKNDEESKYKGVILKQHEYNFVLRGGYPDSYLKFIWKEDWFLSMNQKVSKRFQKNRDLPTKKERILSLWTNIYKFCSELMTELK